MKYFLSILAVVLVSLPAGAQFAPQAGIMGSTAIHASSTLFVNWASSCTVKRGLQDIAQPSLGYVTAGDSTAGTGSVDHFVVSLGDSGVAVLGFPTFIINGPGADFAVFENGFPDPADPALAFLELAFVEVSSDGVSFVRFPAASFTQTDTQIAGSGVYMDAVKINNLAGKYMSNYGTPFDLEELAGTPGLDINRITHVRIVDVIGSLDGYSSYDTAGNRINDPYPTPFPIGGFDLDAVGVIHQGAPTVVTEPWAARVRCYPNPVRDQLIVTSSVPGSIIMTDLSGREVLRNGTDGTSTIDLSRLQAGVYLLYVTDQQQQRIWTERIIKR